MRLAIVSDIHGNFTALEAVVEDIARRGVERVIHGGDLALAGCQPAEAIDRVRELGWPGVVGNVDELLWRPEEHAVQRARAPKLRDLLRLLFDDYAPATRELLGEARIEWLRALPPEHREGDLTLVHASPGDLWRAPMPEAGDAQLISTYGPCGTSLVVYGHIHRPFVRRVGDLTVANSGSVGAPLDADPRASYLLVDAGGPQVVRVEYDVEREASLLMRSGYPDAARIAETRRRATFLPIPVHPSHQLGRSSP
jgi:putative phosphoesterase